MQMTLEMLLRILTMMFSEHSRNILTEIASAWAKKENLRRQTCVLGSIPPTEPLLSDVIHVCKVKGSGSFKLWSYRAHRVGCMSNVQFQDFQLIQCRYLHILNITNIQYYIH